MVVIGQGAPARWSAPDGSWSEPDLHAFPQDGHRYEIVDGSLHVTPPQDASHDAVVARIVAVLRAAAPEDWWVCDRTGVAVGDSSLIPDVTVLRPRSSGAVWADPGDVALVVEVESVSSRSYDRLLKPELYARGGIAGFWRVERGVEPVLRAHELKNAGYAEPRTITGAEPVKVDAPFPLRVAPRTWG